MRCLPVLLLSYTLMSGSEHAMYIAMATSKNYVVGAKLPPSGVFRRTSTDDWRQAGYNHIPSPSPSTTTAAIRASSTSLRETA